MQVPTKPEEVSAECYKPSKSVLTSVVEVVEVSADLGSWAQVLNSSLQRFHCLWFEWWERPTLNKLRTAQMEADGIDNFVVNYCNQISVLIIILLFLIMSSEDFDFQKQSFLSV